HPDRGRRAAARRAARRAVDPARGDHRTARRRAIPGRPARNAGRVAPPVAALPRYRAGVDPPEPRAGRPARSGRAPRRARRDRRPAIAQLQAGYAEASGVSSLRIRHNNVIGYYIEVSAANAGKLGADFIHRQTMAGAMRYTTGELAELESKIASAAERALALE